ncbi:MAG: hypothetical protein GY842_21685 [bacterium]|nr:hypothetical protein [bacterium]
MKRINTGWYIVLMACTGLAPVPAQADDIGACCIPNDCVEVAAEDCRSCPEAEWLCAGDANGDGMVNGLDLMLLLSTGIYQSTRCEYDFTCDGIVDRKDVDYVKSPAHWFTCAPPEYCPGGFAGVGTTCAATECAACCLGPNDCVVTTQSLCAATNGVFLAEHDECPVQVIDAEILEPGGDIFVHRNVKVLDCPDGGKRAPCDPGTPIDAWISPAYSAMSVNFGTGYPPIPADFFETGSGAFFGDVPLEGVTLGAPYEEFGDADTLILRSGGDPFDRCSLPQPPEADPVEVDIEILALSLQGTDPIFVTNSGLWDVTVSLSDVHTDGIPGNDPPIGTVSATKTHCNGGTYTSIFNVYTRFTFTKVGNPGMVRVLDTGLLGAPWTYVTLDQATHPPDVEDPAIQWVHDVDPRMAVVNPICTEFNVGITDNAAVTSCDCNTNLVRDTCDIESGTSGDCNANGIPDECDPGPDCNSNGVPDECDIAAGTSLDINDDGIPDECLDPIPTVAEWGLIVMTLLLLTAATVVLRNHQRSRGRSMA